MDFDATSSFASGDARLGSGQFKPPLVSLVVVNHNYAAYVGKTIRSIRQQDYASFECIVVDNASADDSIAVVKDAVAGDPRFTVVKLDENIGQLRGVLHVFDRLRGNFVVVVDADDLLVPEFLSSHVQVHLALSAAVSLTSSDVVEIDADDRVMTGGREFGAGCESDPHGLNAAVSAVRLTSICDADYERLSAATVSVPYWKFKWVWGTGTANMYRRSALETALPDAAKLRHYHVGFDAYFCPMLHLMTGSALICRRLSAYRIHGRNTFKSAPTMKGVREQNLQCRPWVHDLAVLHTILSRAKTFNFILSGDRFWLTIDLLCGLMEMTPRAYFAQAEVRDVLAETIHSLIEARGAHALITELSGRLDFSVLSRLMRTAYPNGLPLSLRWALVEEKVRHLRSASRAKPALYDYAWQAPAVTPTSYGPGRDQNRQTDIPAIFKPATNAEMNVEARGIWADGWAEAQCEVVLAGGDQGLISLDGLVPDGGRRFRSALTVHVDDQEVGSLDLAPGEISAAWPIPPADQPRTITLEFSRVQALAHPDTRKAAMLIREIALRPAATRDSSPAARPATAGTPSSARGDQPSLRSWPANRLLRQARLVRNAAYAGCLRATLSVFFLAVSSSPLAVRELPLSAGWVAGAIMAILGLARYARTKPTRGELRYSICVAAAVFCTFLMLSLRPGFAALATLATITGLLGLSRLKFTNLRMNLHAYDFVYFLRDRAAIAFLMTNLRSIAVRPLLILLCYLLLLAVVLLLESAAIDRTTAALMFVVAAIALAVNRRYFAPALNYNDHWTYFDRPTHLRNFVESIPEAIKAMRFGGVLDLGQAAEKIGDEAPSPENRFEHEPPTIIVILNESTFHPSLFAPALELDPAVSDFFLSADGRRHELRVEAYGGATWKTEFSLLTGIPASCYGSFATHVFQWAADKIQQGLPRYLKQFGYRPVMLNPLVKEFMNADRFYSSVGIEEIFDRRFFNSKTDYEADSFYLNRGLDWLSDHFSRQDNPGFLYIQTMSNHGPHDCRVMNGWARNSDTPFDEYMRRLQVTCRDYADFRAELARRFPDRAFLIVHFGDHQPSFTQIPLDRTRLTEQLTTYGRTNDALYRTYFAVDGVNFKPAIDGALPETIEVSYLGTVILTAAGIPLDAVHALRRNLMIRHTGRLYFADDNGAIAAGLNRRMVEAGLLSPH